MVLLGNALNWSGSLLVGVYLLVVFPPKGDSFLSTWLWFAMGFVYSLIASVTATKLSLRAGRRAWEWLQSDERPTEEERRAVLKLPGRIARITFAHWLVGAVLLFPLVVVDLGPATAFEIATTLLLSALTVAMALFLAIERIGRPSVAYAQEELGATRAGSLGVGPRLLITWLLCSAVPIVMLLLIPIGRDVDEPEDLIGPTIFVACAGLAAGFIATKLATASVTRPLKALREAVDAVGAGDLRVRVAVDDASEVGRLQAGFNAMVDGLRERDRLEDLFRRQVGEDVLAEALERDPALGGQVRTVSVLFVDVAGSTALAQREPPEHVVARLNAFFAQVVAVVADEGGFVNKFEGDAALCVWNAPADQPEHAACALRAARRLRDALDADPTMLEAGIGVSCGPAVAGWLGAESRFEYTVIGDPVNEASRLTELAKGHPSRLLASGKTVEAAGEPEACSWTLGDEVTLRGRSTPTPLAAPVTVGAGAPREPAAAG